MLLEVWHQSAVRVSDLLFISNRSIWSSVACFPLTCKIVRTIIEKLKRPLCNRQDTLYISHPFSSNSARHQHRLAHYQSGQPTWARAGEKSHSWREHLAPRKYGLDIQRMAEMSISDRLKWISWLKAATLCYTQWTCCCRSDSFTMCYTPDNHG